MEFLEAETGCAESARLKLRQATLSLGAYAHHANNKHSSVVPRAPKKVIVKCFSQLRSLAAAPLQTLLGGIHRLREKFAISREQRASWRVQECRLPRVGIKYA